MRKKVNYLGFICLLLAVCSPVEAATLVDLRHQSLAVLQSLKQGESDFKEINRQTDFNNVTHIHLQQTFANHLVWGADAMVHVAAANTNLTAKNSAALMNGQFYRDIAVDLQNTPVGVFQPAQAELAVHAAMIHWQTLSGDKNSLTATKTDLIVFVDEKQKAHWAFLLALAGHNNNALPMQPIYIMDAQTFKVYQHWDNIQTLQDVIGGGFGGNKKIGEKIYDNLPNDLPNLTMQRNGITCYLKNNDVSVYDSRKLDALIQFNCAELDAQHKVFWDGAIDSVNGAYSPANDALYAGQVIKKMYQDWYNIPVLTTSRGKPMLLNMRIHEKIDNAYWDGAQMTFGDGVSLFYPLVSVGIAAHEISHGFTAQHANLIYQGQSGGLNEAFSDMAAQAAEFYATGKNDWQIGAEVLKAENSALRYMDEPTKDCRGGKPGHLCSISLLKDYKNGLDVHFSSGVFNKLFFALSTSPAWDTKKAFAVMVKANMNYWTPTTSFTDAACGVLSAAKDYRYDVNAVNVAAKTVGINTTTC